MVLPDKEGTVEHVWLPPSHPFWQMFTVEELKHMFGVSHVHVVRPIPREHNDGRTPRIRAV